MRRILISFKALSKIKTKSGLTTEMKIRKNMRMNRKMKARTNIKIKISIITKSFKKCYCINKMLICRFLRRMKTNRLHCSSPREEMRGIRLQENMVSRVPTTTIKHIS